MEAQPGEPYRDILLILLAPIGDTLFATPAIRALRQAYPSARISAVVWEANRAVLENNPDVDRLIVFRWGVRFFRRLRAERYDLAVHFAPFHDYYRLLAGIPRRLSLPVPWLFWLLPHGNRRWRQLHARDRYLDVLRPLGLPATPYPLPPILKISGQQEAFAEEWLARNTGAGDELLVGIHAGGSGFRGMKRWSPEGFARVARALGKQVRLVFFGSAEDRPLVQAVLQAGVPDGYVDTCGRLSLSQTIALLSRLDLFIGNDSGPLHLAAAVGVPVVGVYGPTNLMTFHPLGERVRVVTGPVPCPAEFGFIGTRPLWDRRACQGECLASIDPAQVLAAARELLAEGYTQVALQT